MDESKMIEEETRTLLEKLGIKAEVEVSQNDELFSVQIKTEEAGLLIGFHGETLSALQLILTLVISKKLGRFARLVLNVGDWRERQEERLKEMALEAARRVKETNQEVVLTNLAAWQRRVIHLTLANDQDILTQSQGKEPERYIVIRPR